jgi:large subunit ribosomal protein L18
LVVFRSNRFIYAQLVDDERAVTLCAAYANDITASSEASKELYPTPRLKQAYDIGFALAQKAIVVGITTVVFDRAGYKYHGRVKALAEGARAGGLQF